MVARQSFTGSGLEYRIAALEAELAAFESLELNYLGAGLLRGDDDTASSTMKLAATDLHQRITELLMDAAGPIAGVDPGLRDGGQDGVAAGSFCARKYLATRAASIYSGTNEIHRNVIARQLVGVD
jgi:alkylation response protein AidB-like acyl-CoA dehydrogenase